MLLDGTFREHICFSQEISVVVKDFQRAEQIIGAVPVKCQAVGTVVDETVLVCENVIEPV